MTIEEARKDLLKLCGAFPESLSGADVSHLIQVVKVIWDHLDGRGVLSGEPWAGMKFDKNAEEISREEK